jgi:hypothetical protein
VHIPWYSTNQHAGVDVVFGIPKHNERDDFMHPYIRRIIMHLHTAIEETKKLSYSKLTPVICDKVAYMHGDAQKRNASASKHSKPCPM